MAEKIFNFPIKTFQPEDLLEEMLAAEEGTVFVLGEKTIPTHEGNDQVEVTFVQIKKAKD